MVEWKTIKLDNKNFIGMHLILPHQQCYVISSTKCIIVGDIFNLNNMTKSADVFVMERADSFEALLTSKVRMMNSRAQQRGYPRNLTGKEVLLYQNENKAQK